MEESNANKDKNSSDSSNNNDSNIVDSSNFKRFKKCTVEVLSVDESLVVPEANFAEDLDADSLDIVELVMTLEEEFDIEVDEEELEGVDTVLAAFNIISAKL